MLSANYLAALPDELAELFAVTESRIVSDIARRIVKTGNVTSTAAWQIEKLAQMRMMQDEIIPIIADTYQKSEAETRNLFMQAGIGTLEFDDEIYRQAGLNPLPLVHSKALQAVLLAGIKRTNGIMKNFTGTIADTATKAFENELDRAYLGVLSGAFTPQQSIVRAVKELAAKGMEAVAYPSGHVDKMDVALRRALLTGVSQTTGELQLMRAAEMGCDLVEVTSHAGARPSHAQWQGGIYSISGKHPRYKGLVEATGYGTGSGLKGWNCHHDIFPFMEGVSTPSFERDPARHLGKQNGQVYEESQRQRKYERSIRESKRQCAALDEAAKAAKDPAIKQALTEEFNAASVKLKAKEKALKGFLDETGRTRRKDREWSNGFGQSTSSKAVWAKRVETKANKLYNKGSSKENVRAYMQDKPLRSKLSRHDIAFVERINEKEIIVSLAKPAIITSTTLHYQQNLENKADRANLTVEASQKIVDEAKLVLFQEGQDTLKFLADEGYAILSLEEKLITAVPQKWRKKYDKYLKR